MNAYAIMLNDYVQKIVIGTEEYANQIKDQTKINYLNKNPHNQHMVYFHIEQADLEVEEGILP